MLDHPFEGLPFILVSGQARSGTTVLTHAVGAHPQVCSNLKESSYVASVARLVLKNLSQDHIVRELLESSDHFTSQFRNALLHVLFPPQQFADQSECTAISTFSSLQVDMLDGLAMLFPKLLILNIVRNGIEVVASRATHKHLSKYPFAEHCNAYKHAIDVPKWGAEQSNFQLIKHEAMFDQESLTLTFKEMQNRIGLEDSSACEDFILKNQINSKFKSHDSQKRKAELQQRSERWKAWTKEERHVFKSSCETTMKYFGYSIPW